MNIASATYVGSSEKGSELQPARLANFHFSPILVAILSGSIGLIALSSPLFFYRLAERDLWSSHEARAAQDAQTMLLDQQWGMPRLFDRRPDLQKPPLYYWLVAAIARLRGDTVDAWAVRLPAACAACAGLWMLYLLGVVQRRPLAGLIAAVLLA